MILLESSHTFDLKDKSVLVMILVSILNPDGTPKSNLRMAYIFAAGSKVRKLIELILGHMDASGDN